jgi:arylformamidase
MALIDISRTLTEGTAVWPGDTPFQMLNVLSRYLGQSVNLNSLSTSIHCGTHIDSPFHFTDDGATSDRLDLTQFWGLAQVVHVAKTHGPLVKSDFDGYDLRRAARLLVRSAASEIDQSLFPHAFVFPSPELADYLGESGIILLGTDAPSMDAEDSKTLDGHQALARNGIAILEWLNLRGVPDGLFELAALPLKIAGADGSPVRAVLRTLE